MEPAEECVYRCVGLCGNEKVGGSSWCPVWFWFSRAPNQCWHGWQRAAASSSPPQQDVWSLFCSPALHMVTDLCRDVAGGEGHKLSRLALWKQRCRCSPCPLSSKSVTPLLALPAGFTLQPPGWETLASGDRIDELKVLLGGGTMGREILLYLRQNPLNRAGSAAQCL